MDANSYCDLVIRKFDFPGIQTYEFKPVFTHYRGGQFAQASVIFQMDTGRMLVAFNEWDRETYIVLARGGSSAPDHGLANGSEWVDIRAVLSALELPVPYGAIFWSSPRPDLQLEYWAQVLAPHWRQIIAFPSQPGFQALLEERSRNAAHPGMDQKKASFRKDLLYILATLLFIGALYLISFLNLPQGLEQSLTCTVLVLFILVLFGPPLWSQYLARHRDS